jgi:hypothetical protein
MAYARDKRLIVLFLDAFVTQRKPFKISPLKDIFPGPTSPNSKAQFRHLSFSGSRLVHLLDSIFTTGCYHFPGPNSHWQNLCVGSVLSKMLSDCLKQGVRYTARSICLLALLAFPRLTLATSGPAVALSWDQSTDPTVTGYNVYYGTSSRGYTNIVAAGNSTSTIVSNLTPGVTYYFAATTYTATGLESDYSAEASYAAPGQPPIQAPTLDTLNNLTIAQDSGQQTVNLTGISAGTSNANQTISISAFSSNPSLIPNPIVTYSSPNSNGTLAFTSAPGSFGSTTITVMVDNGLTVSNTIIRSFIVIVNPVDNPPTIDLLSDLALNENCGFQTIALTGITCGSTNPDASLKLTAVSSNPNLIPNPVINYLTPASTATLNFFPSSNSFGAAQITVTVSDNQPTNNSATMSFNIVVNQVAVQPTPLLTNGLVAPTTTFRYLIKSPLNNNDNFSYSLAAGAPLGAKITTRKGTSWVIWTPTIAQASTTNILSLTMNNLSNASLSTNQNLGVSVLDYLSLAVGSTALQAGQNGSVPFTLYSSEGVTNLTFTMPWPTNLLVNPTLAVTAPGMASSSARLQGSDLVINVQMLPGQALLRSNLVGFIGFQTAPGQPSGFVNLPVGTVTAIKPNSQQYVDTVSSQGQLVVVNNLAILQVVQSPGARRLVVLGKVGNNYQIQYCTNFASATPWMPLLSYTQTSVSQSFNIDPTLQNVVYRLQQKQ